MPWAGAGSTAGPSGTSTCTTPPPTAGARSPRFPYPASGTGLVEIEGRLITAGGEDPARGRLIGFSWAYDPAARRWTRLPAMSKPKHGYAVAAHDGRFWAFGGSACYGFEPDADVSSLDAGRS